MPSSWRISDRFDPASVAIADRHYNRQKPGTNQFVPPGACFVMRTADNGALWVTSWPKAEFTQHAWAGAWVNTIFRREDGDRASDLITAAVAHTRHKWPGVPELGIVTFIDSAKVRSKRDPGYCYLMAGWKFVGYTKGGLLVFQQLPDEMPDPEPTYEAQGVLL